jgi:hypothetical protein
MKFITPILVLASILTPVIADGAAITEAISQISNDTIALNTTLSSWTGNPFTVIDIVIESTALLVHINAGTDTAKASANLTLTEAVRVAQATLKLNAVVISALTTIEAKKPLFQKLLLQPVILLNLVLQHNATDSFAAAVVEKVPASLQTYAKTLTVAIDKKFTEAITIYEDFSI